MAPRLYALYEKVNGKWVRRSMHAFKKSIAVSVFQSTLISSYFEGKTYALRPTKVEHDEAVVTR